MGGVFIATLFGLALAMITLAGEVIYYRKKRPNPNEKSRDGSQDNSRTSQKSMQRMAAKAKLQQLKPSTNVAFIGRNRGIRPRITHIPVYPKTFPFKE